MVHDILTEKKLKDVPLQEPFDWDSWIQREFLAVAEKMKSIGVSLHKNQIVIADRKYVVLLTLRMHPDWETCWKKKIDDKVGDFKDEKRELMTVFVGVYRGKKAWEHDFESEYFG
jgi:hypothetical protein